MTVTAAPGDDSSRNKNFHDAKNLHTPASLAAAFKVHPKTVSRWADAGHVRYINTPSGQRRIYMTPEELAEYLEPKQNNQEEE